MRALLLSTYELGRQPFGLASPAAWLRREGWEVDCVDTAHQRLTAAAIAAADLVGIHLPMHTATRLAGPVLATVRRLNPRARVCAYGLYAPLNETWLRSIGVDEVFGGEFEGELAGVARGMGRPGRETDAHAGGPAAATVPAAGRSVPRLVFIQPDRAGLPPLSKYAALQMPDGSRRIVGSTEASRGCKHLCRHCPVVPVYNGQFRIVPPDVVLADVAAQVAAGATHITFGDPDFFNGPTHAVQIVEQMHAAHPELTYDVTIKVEHLLAHRRLLPGLAATGCAFVTSAVESIDDRVLAILDKGHTRADFFEAVGLCRTSGLTLAPTFVAFHPWLALADYCELLETLAALELVDHVAPIQLAIRLLVPEGSRLLDRVELRQHIGPFDPTTLSYPWTHPDPRVDALHQDITALVGTHLVSNRRAVFDEIRSLARARAGLAPAPTVQDERPRAVPFLTEPWYCCAEPNPDEVRLI